MQTPNDEKWLMEALKLAEEAGRLDEVPVGAVVVLERDPETGIFLSEPRVVGEGYNIRETQQNPVGHAELIAIQQAASTLGRWRLTGCTLYVTLEPCAMCAGAIVLSRLDRVVYGAADLRAGAVTSVFQILTEKKLNHHPQITSGVLEAQCSNLLKEFFAKKRATL